MRVERIPKIPETPIRAACMPSEEELLC